MFFLKIWRRRKDSMPSVFTRLQTFTMFLLKKRGRTDSLQESLLLSEHIYKPSVCSWHAYKSSPCCCWRDEAEGRIHCSFCLQTSTNLHWVLGEKVERGEEGGEPTAPLVPVKLPSSPPRAPASTKFCYMTQEWIYMYGNIGMEQA